MFKHEWWVQVHEKAPQIKEKIIYHMVEKMLFGETQEEDNIAIRPFILLVGKEVSKSNTFDLTANKNRLEAICMQNSISYEDCLNYIDEFNKFNQSRDISHKNYAEAINHFTNWLRLQLKQSKIDYKSVNELLLKDAKSDYKHFVSWVRVMTPYCFANMIMPTPTEIQELKDMGISGNVATKIITEIENNIAFRSRRRNLFIAIKEIWNCKT